MNDLMEKEKSYFRNACHMDDASAAFAARQLNHVRAQVLQTKKPPLNAFTVFPVQTDIPEGAETATQLIYDAAGMAEIITNYSDDLPRVDVLAAEIPVKVKTLGIAYGFTKQEVENAMFARVNLSAMKAVQARRGIDVTLNKLAWKGDAKHNLIGFLNNKNISEYTLKADGTGSSMKFEDKTPKQIVRDIKEIINVVHKATKGVQKVDTLLLSTDVYTHLTSTEKNEYSNITIMDYIRGVFPTLKRVIEVSELDGAGEGGKDILVAGAFMPENVKLEIPKRFDQLPVQERNLEFIVNCTARAVGVTVSDPVAFVRVVGV